MDVPTSQEEPTKSYSQLLYTEVTSWLLTFLSSVVQMIIILLLFLCIIDRAHLWIEILNKILTNGIP